MAETMKTFIPEIWSARLLSTLQKAHVYANLLNRDYEGEISQYGDTVHINSVGPVSVFDYVTNEDMPAPELLDTTKQSLVINQQKGFNFQINDVSDRQIRSSVLTETMDNAAYELSDVNDLFVAKLLASKAGITIPEVVVTPDNAYELLVTMRTKLDKANVPKAGRWVVLPPEYEGMTLQDQRLAGAFSGRSEGQMTDGEVPRVAGFNIYMSNNVPVTGGKYSIIASSSLCGTYAEQILMTERLRMEARPAYLYRGLHVYGALITRPEIVAKLTATF